MRVFLINSSRGMSPSRGVQRSKLIWEFGSGIPGAAIDPICGMDLAGLEAGHGSGLAR
ncbi:hypothetical protein EVJ58_g198 [Rhodofomes roseus]|uniref:Uncharacterized protein n=1 Tax=Rhodofomes roseus TaxID=34475 RepID=A0A4Y9Z8Y6_9APHY|nr:hypothetical protein EVJ58_g198 [Rhodofomes roseus]